MVMIIKQKQLRLPISIVRTSTYMQGSCMITIGKIPKSAGYIIMPLENIVTAIPSSKPACIIEVLL